jgi:hypothetical protein
MSQTQSNPLDRIKADCSVVAKQIKTMIAGDAEVTSKAVLEQIAYNVVPLISALADEVAEVDDIVQEVVEREESYLHPEIGQQILGTFALGQAVLAIMREHLLPNMDDIARKKAAELCDGFEKSMELSIITVTAIVDDDGDDDDDDDVDPDETDTPIEVPNPVGPKADPDKKEDDDADDESGDDGDLENGPAAG